MKIGNDTVFDEHKSFFFTLVLIPISIQLSDFQRLFFIEVLSVKILTTKPQMVSANYTIKVRGYSEPVSIRS